MLSYLFLVNKALNKKLLSYFKIIKHYKYMSIAYAGQIFK